MAREEGWQETADGFALGSARAQRFPEDKEAFVITTFGDEATVDTALECIVAAVRMDQPIAIRDDEPNRSLALQLKEAGLVRFTPWVGLPFKAFGVAAVKQDAVG